MKLVIAFIKPFMAPDVVQALHGVKGLSGATFTEVRGFGRGRAQAAPPSTEEELLGTAPHIRVEVFVPDSLEDTVLQVIQKSAHTGNRGDGKVYVIPASRALRIGTGEEGEIAI